MCDLGTIVPISYSQQLAVTTGSCDEEIKIRDTPGNLKQALFYTGRSHWASQHAKSSDLSA